MTYTEVPPWHEGPLPHRPCARIIQDSIAENGLRATTFEVKVHRFILAEVNTHTLFSRNSASSRAIPLRSKDRPDGSNPRMGTLDRLEDLGPAFPIRWPLEQPGMQGGDEEADVLQARLAWSHSMQDAIEHAEQLESLGVHKSIANRVLEPYGYHVATITAVDWVGFFRQRSWNHTKLVQPEFGLVATLVEDLYMTSTPSPVGAGEWHTPYIRPDEMDEFPLWDRLRISAARTARTSYLTHDGKRDPQADLSLYGNLTSAEPPHASPLQHVMTPDPENEFNWRVDPADYGLPGEPSEYWVPIVGNCRGWMQMRHLVLGF